MEKVKSKYRPQSTVTIFCPRHPSFHRKGTVESIKAGEDRTRALRIVIIKQGQRKIRLGWIKDEDTTTKGGRRAARRNTSQNRPEPRHRLSI